MSLRFIAMVHDFTRTTSERYIEQDGPERGKANWRRVANPSYGKLVAHCVHGAVVSLYDAPYKATSPVKQSNERLDRMLASARAAPPSTAVTDFGDETDVALIESWPRACVKYFDTDDLATWGADQDTAAQEHESASVRRAEKAIKAMRGEAVDAPAKKKKRAPARKRRAIGTVIATEVLVDGRPVRDGQTYDLTTSARSVVMVAPSHVERLQPVWLRTDGAVVFGPIIDRLASNYSRVGVVNTLAYDSGQRTASVLLDPGVAPTTLGGEA